MTMGQKKLIAASKRGRNRLLPALVPAVLLFVVVAPAWGENLLSVYHSAFQSSYRLQRVRSDLTARQASRDEARAGLLPKLRAAATLNRNDTTIEGFGEDFAGGALPPGVFSGDIEKTHTGGSYGFRLIQPLVDGQAWSALKASKARIEAQQAAVSVAVQNLILEVVDGYFTLLGVQADAQAVEARQKLLAETLARAEADLETGTGDIIAVHEARADYDGVAAALVQARNAVRIARARLERLAHRTVGPLADVGQLQARNPSPNRVAPWLRMAVDQHPLLQQMKSRLTAVREQIRFQQRARWPELNAVAGYGYDKGQFLPSSERWQGRIGLQLTLSLYEGGAIGARVRRAQARAQSMDHRLQELQDRISLETENAFLRLQDSVARLAAASRARTSAQVSLQATRKGGRVGTRTIVDLLAAIEALEAAERGYQRARYHHVTSWVRLKAAAGVISEDDLGRLNDRLGNPSPQSGLRPMDYHGP